MLNRLPGTSTPEFIQGEAEEMVKNIRREFRAAASKRETGDVSGAARTERRANELLEAFRQHLQAYLGRQIQRQIGFASSGEKEDAIAELQYKVLVYVKDTVPSPSADHWERRFNQCVQRRAIDICRPVQKRYGYGTVAASEHATSPVPREINFSALDTINQNSVSESRFVDRLTDEKAERELEAFLSAETLQQLIARLGPKDRDNLALWWRQLNGETWETIGASENLLPDTVRKRAQAVLLVLRKIVGA